MSGSPTNAEALPRFYQSLLSIVRHEKQVPETSSPPGNLQSRDSVKKHRVPPAVATANDEAQEELFAMVTENIRVPREALRQFWDVLVDGRSHAFLVVTESILGNPELPKNTNIAVYRGFRQMVQLMCDNEVVTWTHTLFKKEIVDDKDKKELEKKSLESEDEEGEIEDENKQKDEKQKEKKYKTWTDGVLRLTDKAFPGGRPR